MNFGCYCEEDSRVSHIKNILIQGREEATEKQVLRQRVVLLANRAFYPLRSVVLYFMQSE